MKYALLGLSKISLVKHHVIYAPLGLSKILLVKHHAIYAPLGRSKILLVKHHAIYAPLAATKISLVKPLATRALPTLTLYRPVNLCAIAWSDTLALVDTQTALKHAIRVARESTKI